MARQGDADRKPDEQPQAPDPAARPGTVPDDRHEGNVPPTVPDSPLVIGGLMETNMSPLGETANRGDGSTMLLTDTPYQLVRKIGSGAFGEVFEALAPGGVRVAIKRILRDVNHPASLSEKDALDAIKGLSHPFLLKTNAYWVFDDRLVIVMELADGSLADRVEYHQSQGRPGAPPEELLPIFEQASEALDYLHTQNVSHRDVKPENILVMQGYAKVADFGLARLHEHAMTVVQNTVGTPAYMAPEMWKHKVSLQSDQYSLAATYVKARLGRPLFATNVLVDMANFHINEAPNLDPLPEPEQAVLRKALAKKPDERYSSCVEFARALRLAVLPPPPPAPQLEQGRGDGRRIAWGTVAVALVCALTVGAVSWFLPPREPPKGKESETEKPVVPEKKFAAYPAGWTPVEETGTHAIGDRHYHRRLTRTVAGETLVAILVFPVRPDQPDAFYMFQNKITNRVFSATWEQVKKSQDAQLRKLPHPLVRGVWKRGAENLDPEAKEEDRYLGTEGAQAGVPVLSVTVPEAILVAGELGGQLPTSLQWKKAFGAMGDDARDSSAGDALVVPPELLARERGDFKRKKLSERNLALGLLKGPWPVEKLTADVSYCGVHQLVSNGQEWVGEDISGQPFNLADIGDGERGAARTTGQGPQELVVTTFAEHKFGSQGWTEVKGGAATGFRVVLKPR